MQTNNETRTDDLLEELASDYANYMVIDSSSEVVTIQFVFNYKPINQPFLSRLAVVETSESH